MARPAEFDREKVVEAAISVFARHGYAAASTTDLLDSMGIGRQSLYGAFGDKRRLFLEALESYNAGSLNRMFEAMAGGGDALDDLKASLLIDLGTAAEVERGCLGVGSITEFGRSDPGVNALNDRAGLAVIAAFADRVRSGIADGDLDPTLDPEAVARMLLTVRSGLKVAARAGAGKDEISESARLALSGLGRR